LNFWLLGLEIAEHANQVADVRTTSFLGDRAVRSHALLKILGDQNVTDQIQ
jgi:hypothetical protein